MSKGKKIRAKRRRLSLKRHDAGQKPEDKGTTRRGGWKGLKPKGPLGKGNGSTTFLVTDLTAPERRWESAWGDRGNWR